MSDTSEFTNSLIYLNITINIITFSINIFHLYKTHKLKTIAFIKEKVKNNITSLSNVIIEKNEIMDKNINETINKKNIQLDKINITLQDDEAQV